MMLRLFLMGLVTSMGLELPSSRDVSTWVESGRAWANANICVMTSAGVAVVPIAEVAECHLTPADLAFQAAQGEMTADFGTDGAIAAADLPARNPAGEPAGVAADESIAVGLPAGEEIAAIVAAEVAVEVAASEPAPAAPADEPAVAAEDDAPSRSDRLASAVRLTREAVEAWAAVIQEPADEAGCSR